ncbi:MAG TPA: phosphatase PAP2 family protein [Rhizomicrobium sp.]|jgi:acid phosphatase (class A)|nr:phosphatase PAP2 family protein [Rhizomicrobium sp.]
MLNISRCASAIPFLMIAVCFAGPGQAAMLDPAEIDASRLLPPPPAAESARAKAEIVELHAIAASSSDALMEAVRRDDADEKSDLFNAALGFDITKLPAANKLLNDVLKEEEISSKAAKAYFHRDRPWIVDASIKTCVPEKPGPAANSYPSGHATVAYSMGVVLAELVPQKAQAILTRSSEFAEHRLVCGVHFRSDIVAGQEFGTVLALRLMEKPAFKAEMDAARAELRSAHYTD